MEIGSTITKLRKGKDLTREDLGKTVHTSGAVIGRYERNEITPSIETAFEIAKALEVSLDYLVCLSDLELDESIVNNLEKLNTEDKESVLTTINMINCNAKTRNTYT